MNINTVPSPAFLYIRVEWFFKFNMDTCHVAENCFETPTLKSRFLMLCFRIEHGSFFSSFSQTLNFAPSVMSENPPPPYTSKSSAIFAEKYLTQDDKTKLHTVKKSITFINKYPSSMLLFPAKSDVRTLFENLSRFCLENVTRTRGRTFFGIYLF